MTEDKKTTRRKKPDFTRKDAHKKAKVKFRWRKPRGKHSPVRQRHLGRPKLVSIGFGSPKKTRHLHPSGLEKVIINHLGELEKIDSKKQGLLISRRVGNRKKIEMIKIALEKKITFLNIKEPQKYLEELQSLFQKRKESKKKRLSEKEKKEREKKKEAEEKEKEEKEEKERKEKEEKEKEEKEKQEEKTADKKGPFEETKKSLEETKERKEEKKKEEERKEEKKKEEERKEIEKTLIKKQ